MRFLVSLLVFLTFVVHDGYAQQNSELSKDTSLWYNRTQQLEGVTVRSKRSRYSRKNNPAVELMRKVIERKKRFEVDELTSRQVNKLNEEVDELTSKQVNKLNEEVDELTSRQVDKLNDSKSNNSSTRQLVNLSTKSNNSSTRQLVNSSTYNRYQKIMFGVNDVKLEDLESGLLSKIPNALNHIEACPYNNKLILPLTLSEIVSKKYHRHHPEEEREVVIGERAVGINEMFQSGNLITEALKDFFKSVDIYDDQISLLQTTFTSPIGKDALGFYRYYIIDTLAVGGDRCIHLRYVPNNVQDFGFAGNIYIMDDSTYRVKRCELVVPASGSVNFVDCLMILQEYSDVGNGHWALTTDDMIVELHLFDFMQRAIVVRNTRMTDHAFGKLPKSIFRNKNKKTVEPDAKYQSETFWHNHRPFDLSGSERRLTDLVSSVQDAAAGHKWMKLLLKAVVEGYVETGSTSTPSKFDIGPVTSFVSRNDIDGLRLSIGGQTTAYLHPHLFFNGSYTYATKSREHYYNAQLTYSLNRKEYLPQEFPIRNISFSSTRDMRLASEKFNPQTTDDIFSMFKWSDRETMMRYNRQQLALEREEQWGLRTTLTAAVERVSEITHPLEGQGEDLAELSLALRYSPGENFVSTKKGRRHINQDAPVYTLKHTLGLKNVLGGDYNYNLTEASIYNRFWLNSWGHLDMHLTGAVQWNDDVPWWLLCMPAVNLSYVSQPGMFNLINDLEFISDRQATLHLSWDMNGKLLNRIPLISRLKWREHVGVKMMLLNECRSFSPPLNNTLGVHEFRSSDGLTPDPSPKGEGSTNNLSTCQLVNLSTPSSNSSTSLYLESVIGIHNIFRFFSIDYVRRYTHLDRPEATKHGVRLGVSFKF